MSLRVNSVGSFDSCSPCNNGCPGVIGVTVSVGTYEGKGIQVCSEKKRIQLSKSLPEPISSPWHYVLPDLGFDDILTAVAHAVICSEHIGGLVVSVKLFELLGHFFDTCIHDLDVVKVEFRCREVGVSVGVEAQKMEEKNNFVRVQLLVQGWIGFGILEQFCEMLKHPGIQNTAVS